MTVAPRTAAVAGFVTDGIVVGVEVVPVAATPVRGTGSDRVSVDGADVTAVAGATAAAAGD